MGSSMDRLSVLDLFVLCSIDRGLRSGYALQRQGGLSLGATSPSLKRLVKAGLLTRESSGTAKRRERYDFTLTAAGRKLVRKGWKDFRSGAIPVSDIDTILRLVDLSAHYGESGKKIERFLTSMIEAKAQQGERLSLALAQQKSTTPAAYRDLRARFDVARSKMEVAALSEIRDLIVGDKRGRQRTQRRRLAKECL
jgi:DNA-binding MarR family transcriptional regulator